MVDKAIDCSGRAAQSYKRVPDSKDEGGSSYEISASNLQENLSFGSSTVTKEDSDERIFWWLTRVFIAFFLRILSLVYALGFKEGRLNNTHPSDSHNSAAEHSLTRRNIEDHLSPCFERLQKLEVKFDELTNKPAEIPFEKEQVLHESWDRIKHIEFELERTKRALWLRICSIGKQLSWDLVIALLLEVYFWSRYTSHQIILSSHPRFRQFYSSDSGLHLPHGEAERGGGEGEQIRFVSRKEGFGSSGSNLKNLVFAAAAAGGILPFGPLDAGRSAFDQTRRRYILGDPRDLFA